VTRHVVLTEPQSLAVTRPRGLVCVEAGAGTGKTAVIVERYLHLLQVRGLHPSAILAITYTRKAAQEMKRRILKRLGEVGLGAMRREVEAGYIHTIHGFCERLLRENPFDAGIDPRFSVLASTDAAREVERAFRAACTSSLSKTDPLGDLLQAGSTLQGWRDAGEPFEVLRREVRHLLDRIRSYGLTREEVDQWIQDLEATAGNAAGIVCQLMAEVPLARAREALQKAEGDQLRQLIELLPDSLAAVDARQALAHFVQQVLAVRPRQVPPEDVALCNELLGIAGALGKSLADITPEREEVAARRSAAMLRLALSTWTMYEEGKTRAAALDFSDLELLSVRLLETCEPLRERCRLRFRQILVDEFQDVNPLQARLIRCLAEVENVCFVGDPRQAIFGFRHGDVRQFSDWAAETQRLVPDAAYIPLTDSFRSRPGILRFVSEAMRRGCGKDFGLLRAQRSSDESAAGEVEIWTGGRDELRDADVVARGVRRLLASGALVGDGADRRPVQAGDIAVLFRVTTPIAAYRDALMRVGVPAVIIRAGRWYWVQHEVRDVRNGLAALANPHDDFALACLLRSPMVGLSLDALTLLCADRKGSSVFERLTDGSVELPAEDRAKVEEMLGWFQPIGRFVDRREVGAVMEEMLTRTQYRPKLLCRADGARQLANVRKLQSLAFAVGDESIASFVRRLDRMKRISDREGDAPIHDEGADAVGLMTIHGAKGLEFPVVIVADAGNLPGAQTARVFVEPAERLLAVNMDDEPSTMFREMERRQRMREQEEEWRLLYVAMTRAKDKLVLSLGRPRGRSSNRLDLRRALGLNVQAPNPGIRSLREGAEFVVRDMSADE